MIKYIETKTFTMSTNIENNLKFGKPKLVLTRCL